MINTLKVICASLIICGLTMFFGYADSSKVISFKDKQKGTSNELIIEEKKLEEESEFLKTELKYPFLKTNEQSKNKGIDNKVINQINKDIEDVVFKFRNDIKSASKEYAKGYKEGDMKYKYEVFSEYKVAYNKDNTLSIPFTMYEFTGGAHGMTNIKSFNYDLLTGEEILLKDMFKDGVDYKSVLNSYIKDDIDNTEDKNIYFTGDMGFKGIGDNQNFYISEDGIVVYFSLYEIAPYSSGIPMFTISWDQLNKYLR
ncbi:MAG: DUF3298 and DUF4163 domain-containing protein [Romboutsia sp.]